MHKGTTAALGVLGTAAVLALGFAVAGLASSSDVTGVLTGTSESTTESTTASTPGSTTETPTISRFRSGLIAGSEVPKPTGVKAGASGTFTTSVSLHGAVYTGTFTLSFRLLTGKAVAAHIHAGKAGKAGPVLVSLCGPCTSGKAGKVAISKAAYAAMKSGATYVNVHTAKNPGGEIRGQVKKPG